MEKKRKEKGNYVFPSIMAKMMKGISQRTQYEATMMAIIFILIGLTIMCVLTVFFTEVSWFFKIMAVVNGAAAFVFLSSHLVTQFQQYQNYLAVMGIIEDYDSAEISETQTPQTNPVDNNKFLGGSNEEKKSI